MVAGRTVLILLVVLLPGWAVAQPGCEECHPAHYAASGSCTACHRGNARTDRIALAHSDLIGRRFAWFALPASPVTRSGSRLLDTAGCRRCHRSGGKGNTLATDLDRLLPAARTEDILRSILHPVQFMPDFSLPEEPAVALVNALLAHAARAVPTAGETPLVVHFEGMTRQENVFDKECGRCHRLLTHRGGGLGVGAVGPNLSGLFSEFYPVRFREQEPWTAANLEKWLKNPRAIRSTARMAPIRLEPEAQRQLLEIFIDTDQGRRPGHR